MYPDLLEIFGITLYGVMFERVLWLISASLMLWGVVSSILIYLKGRKGEAIVQMVIVFVLLLWFGSSFLGTFDEGYSLVFREPVVIHTYAFCILIGIACGIGVAMWMGPRRGMSRMWIAKLCLWCVLIGFIGARGAYVIVERQFFIDSCVNPSLVGLSEPNCWRFLNVSEGGLVFYGGVITGFLVLIGGWLWQRRRNPKFKALALADTLVPALAAAHGFGRIGCIAAGCCWGALTRSGGGIHYKPGSFAYEALLKDPAWHDVVVKAGETPGIHATQLYEAGVEFLFLGLICFLAYRQHKRIEAFAMAKSEEAESKSEEAESKSENIITDNVPGVHYGRLASLWLIGYGVSRIIIECMRDDGERGYFFERVIEPVNEILDVSLEHATIFTTSQGIGVVMIVIGVVFLIMSNKKCV